MNKIFKLISGLEDFRQIFRLRLHRRPTTKSSKSTTAKLQGFLLLLLLRLRVRCGGRDRPKGSGGGEAAPAEAAAAAATATSAEEQAPAGGQQGKQEQTESGTSGKTQILKSKNISSE